MKRSFIKMLVFCLMLLQLYSTTTIVKAAELRPSAEIATTAAAQPKISIIRSVTDVNRGDIGFITIQGRPGVKYTIRSSFKIGNRTIPVTQWRIGDSKGFVIFNWVVGGDTVPGTYPITISGDGETINLSHTVFP